MMPVQQQPKPLSSRKKAAALILALGSRNAYGVLQQLSRAEIERLANEISALDSKEVGPRDGLMKEVLIQVLTRNPKQEEKQLRKIAAEIGERERISMYNIDPDAPSFEFIQKVEFEQAIQFLKSEHPQTVALILYFQPPTFAAQVLASFDDDVAGDISLRIATLGRTPPELILRIEQAMRKRLTEAEDTDGAGPEGEKELAQILNNVDPDLEKWILADIGELDPELAERVRALMFVFEDIVTLENRTIQQVLQAIDTNTLALALKGASRPRAPNRRRRDRPSCRGRARSPTPGPTRPSR